MEDNDAQQKVLEEALRRQWQHEARKQQTSTEVVQREKPPTARPYWVPDDDCSVCMRCGDHFGVFRPRRHCHSCGKLYDRKCCGELMKLPNLSYESPVEVCLLCKVLYETVYDMRDYQVLDDRRSLDVRGQALQDTPLRSRSKSMGAAEPESSPPLVSILQSNSRTSCPSLIDNSSPNADDNAVEHQNGMQTRTSGTDNDFTSSATSVVAEWSLEDV